MEINEESVADLRVMFSIHKMHYSAMLNSRLCAITDVYAAQLGHIAGHMFSRIAIPETDFDPDERAANILKEQGDRYKKKFDELFAGAGGVCEIRDCGEKAVQFRSLPHFTEDEEIIYRDRVLCTLHTKRWDDERTLQ